MSAWDKDHDPDTCGYCESCAYDQSDCEDCKGTGGTAETSCDECDGHGFWGYSWQLGTGGMTEREGAGLLTRGRSERAAKVRSLLPPFGVASVGSGSCAPLGVSKP